MVGGGTFGGAAGGGGGGFGGAAAGGNVFGTKPATGAAPTGFGFGSSTTGGAFGSTPAATPGFGAQAGFGAPAGFGAQAASGAPSLFGTTSAPALTTSLFGAAAATTAPTSSPFGTVPAASTTNAFGGFNAPATSAAAPATLSFTSASSAATTPFGTTAAAPSSFGTTPAAPGFGTTLATPGFGTPVAGSTSLFGGSKPATPGGGLFGGGTAAPASSAAAVSPFGAGLSAPGSTAPATAPLFGAGAKPAGTTGLLGGAPSASNATTPGFGARTPASNTLFQTIPASTAASSAAAAPLAFGLSGATTSTAGSSAAASAPSFTLNAAPTTAPAGISGIGLTTRPQDNASSKAAVPPTPSALRNKSMDEILLQWSKQLDEHTKAFRTQAEKISQWDRKLFSNGHQISQLYQMTVETEGTQKTIDQNLDYIDSQQQELSGILDLYEDQVQKLFEKDATTAGVNANGLRPVDEQREQTYSLAENLNKQLDDMSLNLTSMIEEINQTAPKGDGESSDPIGQIVQILNAHLTSLQWIDDTTTSLQSKVQDVGRLQNQIVQEHESYRSRGMFSGRT
ncbi:FG-nucleoporin nsp1 [Dissophora ornata]|nr:FG-nucleoporin nsp1 [Dissophora ornata]